MSDGGCAHESCLDFCEKCCYCFADLRELRIRKAVYSVKINIEDFSIDSVIALMKRDKTKLVKRWGLQGYEERLRLLEERK